MKPLPSDMAISTAFFPTEKASSASTDENELQSLPFEVARTSGMAPKDFFQLFYETVFGQARGPRFGTFVLLVGKEKAVSMLDAVCGK